MEQAILEQVDHLTIKTTDPLGLYETLTQFLLLRPAWQVTINPIFSSAGIQLGPLDLELLHFHPSGARHAAGRSMKKYAAQAESPILPVTGGPTSSSSAGHARLYGLAFQLAPFDQSLPELARRNIPYTPPQPMVLVDDQGWQVTSRTNVYIGGLFGSRPIEHLFFNLVQRTPLETWEKGTLPTQLNRRLSLPFVHNAVFRRGVVMAVEHNPAQRKLSKRGEIDHAGLDVTGVHEIGISTRNFNQSRAAWQAFLHPIQEIEPGIWPLPGNIFLRLHPGDIDAITRLVLRVSSLNRAIQFLHRRDMLGPEIEEMVTILPSRIQGLDFRLVQ